jgi:hypothetical protein
MNDMDKQIEKKEKKEHTEKDKEEKEQKKENKQTNKTKIRSSERLNYEFCTCTQFEFCSKEKNSLKN